MRGKEKFILAILVIMFVMVAGMFWYSNFYLEQKKISDDTKVFVAIKDIPKGEVLSAKNFGLLTIKKGQVFPNYVTNMKEIDGKIANSNILKNEIINKGRLLENTAKINTFSVLVKPSNRVDVKEGDIVNIYMQVTYKNDSKKINYETYYIAKREVVQETLMKKNSSGKATDGNIESIRVTLSEEEAVNYHLVDYMKELSGTVIVIPYVDIMQEDNANIKPMSEFDRVNKVKELSESALNKGSATTLLQKATLDAKAESGKTETNPSGTVQTPVTSPIPGNIDPAHKVSATP